MNINQVKSRDYLGFCCIYDHIVSNKAQCRVFISSDTMQNAFLYRHPAHKEVGRSKLDYLEALLNGIPENVLRKGAPTCHLQPTSQSLCHCHLAKRRKKYKTQFKIKINITHAQDTLVTRISLS